MMNIIRTDLNIMPKDCSSIGVPQLPCDQGDNKVDSSQSLAMAYVRVQSFHKDNLYEGEIALQKATIFKDLDLPFYGIGGSLV